MPGASTRPRWRARSMPSSPGCARADAWPAHRASEAVADGEAEVVEGLLEVLVVARAGGEVVVHGGGVAGGTGGQPEGEMAVDEGGPADMGAERPFADARGMDLLPAEGGRTVDAGGRHVAEAEVGHRLEVGPAADRQAVADAEARLADGALQAEGLGDPGIGDVGVGVVDLEADAHQQAAVVVEAAHDEI